MNNYSIINNDKGNITPGTKNPGTVNPSTVNSGTVKPDTVNSSTVKPASQVIVIIYMIYGQYYKLCLH